MPYLFKHAIKVTIVDQFVVKQSYLLLKKIMLIIGNIILAKMIATEHLTLRLFNRRHSSNHYLDQNNFEKTPPYFLVNNSSFLLFEIDTRIYVWLGWVGKLTLQVVIDVLHYYLDFDTAEGFDWSELDTRLKIMLTEHPL